MVSFRGQGFFTFFLEVSWSKVLLSGQGSLTLILQFLKVSLRRLGLRLSSGPRFPQGFLKVSLWFSFRFLKVSLRLLGPRFPSRFAFGFSGERLTILCLAHCIGQCLGHCQFVSLIDKVFLTFLLEGLPCLSNHLIEDLQCFSLAVTLVSVKSRFP